VTYGVIMWPGRGLRAIAAYDTRGLVMRHIVSDVVGGGALTSTRSVCRTAAVAYQIIDAAITI